MRSLLAIPLVVLAGTPAMGQTVGQNRSADTPDNYTLSLKVQLVAETVVVKDKQGNPIRGLTAKDFAVSEDGIPQIIRFCEHEDLASHARVLPLSKRGDEDIHIYKKLARTQITPEATEEEKYQNR